MIEDRQLPSNVEFEKAILGRFIFDSETFFEWESHVNFEDFWFKPHHWRIFQAIQDASPNIDLLSVSEVIPESFNKEFPGIDPDVEMMKMMDILPTGANLGHYIHCCTEHYKLREVMKACTKVYHDWETGDFNKTYAYLSEVLQKVDSCESVQAPVLAKDIMKPALQELYDEWEGKEGFSYSTGLARLDKLFRFRKKLLYIIAARPSIGKTAIGITFSVNLMRQGAKIAFFAVEPGSGEVIRRMIASASGLALQKRNVEGLIRAAEEITKRDVFIIDKAGQDMEFIRSKSLSLKRKYGLDAIIIDYLQLMKASRSEAKNIRERQIADMSAKCKALSKEADISAIVLAQLNRDAEGREPKISDIRESGAVEQDADVIMLLHNDRTQEGTSVDAKLLVRKHRDGETGDVNCVFHKDQSRFIDTHIDNWERSGEYQPKPLPNNHWSKRQ